MAERAVAVIGAGEMGSAVAKRLHDGGCTVVVSIEGRSAASRQRVAAFGVPCVETTRELVAHGDLVLSIVPPGQARQAAEAVACALRLAPRVLTYVDGNALSPQSVRELETIVRSAGATFLDAGIIGGPPRPGEPGPIVFVSGEHPTPMLVLRAAGLDVRTLGPSVGAASALKMSYAGVTKGLIALCALMRHHAREHDLGTEFDAVLAETRPDVWHFLESAVPSMYPKAYRWIAEMREIADYAAPDEVGDLVYSGFARFYERIAAELPGARATSRVDPETPLLRAT